MANPYSVLGVSSSSSADEIRAAYRKLAKKHHPDLNPGNKDAEKKFKEINTANEIIGDPEKRKKFDAGEIDENGAPRQPFEQYTSGAQAGRGPFYYQTQDKGGRYTSSFSGVDPKMFEDLFGGSFQFDSGDFNQRDEHYSLEVTLKDAVLGSEKEVTLPSGKTVKVRIPAGIESGKRLRMKGGSEASQQGQPPGDIYIEIKVKPSKLFSREGNNLTLELPVTLSEAILGGEVRVPTLEGAVMLKIPAGSDSGTKLRVKGKGGNSRTAKARGDLIVTLNVVLPAQVTPELKQALRSSEDMYPYNPRKQMEKES